MLRGSSAGVRGGEGGGREGREGGEVELWSEKRKKLTIYKDVRVKTVGESRVGCKAAIRAVIRREHVIDYEVPSDHSKPPPLIDRLLVRSVPLDLSVVLSTA